ncbi:MAG: MFS transporter [Chloroflexota bacterium]
MGRVPIAPGPRRGGRRSRRSMAAGSSRPAPVRPGPGRRLGLSIADIGMLGILGSVAATVACVVWGSYIDRRGAIWVMRIGGLLGFLSIVLYATAPSVAYLWLASIIVGVANASTDLGITAAISEQVPSGSAAPR